MSHLKKRLTVCVFCASSDHVGEQFQDAARKLGTELALRNMVLVYGGGNNGLMGVLSSQMHEEGGTIVGVIPHQLNDMGFGYDRVSEMIVTDDMRTRKTIMEQRADAFIGMAGGFGTLEEILEIITLKQLEIHTKPIVILNTDNFFAGLLEQFEKSMGERFVEERFRSLYHVTSSVSDALDYLERHCSAKTGSPTG